MMKQSMRKNSMVFVLDAEYKIKVVPGTVRFQRVPFRSFSRLGVEYVFSLRILHSV